MYFLASLEQETEVDTPSQSFYDAEILLGTGDVDIMDKPTYLMVQIKAIQNRYVSSGVTGTELYPVAAIRTVEVY